MGATTSKEQDARDFSTRLLPHHQALIEASGIAPDVAAARGYRSVTTRAELGRLGFADSQRNVPALLIPIWGVSGEIETYQCRPDEPRISNGRRLKYETPAKSRMCLDVPPAARDWLGDPTRPLFVTEGARKADAAVSRGLCCVALLGVWNWRGTNGHGGKVALPDWEHVALNERSTYLAFDSDVTTKPPVLAAMTRLKAFLEPRGAKVQVIYLSAGVGGAKQGLDDFLAAGGTVDDLLALASPDLRDLASDDASRTAGPYEVRDGCLGYRRQSGNEDTWVQLANFTARVAEEVTADDGASERGELVIAGALHDGTALPDARVPLAHFDSLSWVTRQWGARAIIAAGQGNRDRLREAIQRLSGPIERRTEYAHPGWTRADGRWLYLTAEAVIGADGPAEGIAVRLDGPAAGIRLPAPPSGDALRNAVRTATVDALAVAPDRVTVPLLGAVFRAPLNTAVFADLSLFLAGPSGVRKSELGAMAQRYFGAGFDRLRPPASWSATANYLERVAFDFKDAVCLLDDFAPRGSPQDVRRYHAAADRIFRAAGNAAGRGRLQADGSTRPERPPRGLVVATGEDVPTGQSTRARLLVLDVEAGDVDTGRLTSFQAEPGRSAPAHAMAGYVWWLASHLDDLCVSLPDERLTLRAALDEASAHARTPDALANAALGWRVWLRYACDVGVFTLEEAEGIWRRVSHALVALGRDQGAHQASEDAVNVFCSLLADTVASQQAHVAGPAGAAPDNPLAWGWTERAHGSGDLERTAWQAHGPCIGYVDADGLYLLPTAAFAAAQRLGQTGGHGLPVTERTLWKRLHQAGHLRATELPTRQTFTIRKSLAGERKAVLHLCPNFLSPQKPDQPAQSDQKARSNAGPHTEAGSAGRDVWSDRGGKGRQPDHSTRPMQTPLGMDLPADGKVGRNGQVNEREKQSSDAGTGRFEIPRACASPTACRRLGPCEPRWCEGRAARAVA